MKKIFLFIALAGLLFSSCSKFDKINVNPNNPTVIPSEMLLPNIISGAAASVVGSGTRAGQYVQHLAWLGGLSESDGRYNLTGASFREEWNGPMRLIKDVVQLKDLSQKNGQVQYEAVSYILKVYVLSLMTDAYGDIPYDEAGRGNEPDFEFAHFQAQQDVYKLMLADLEKANQLLKNVPAGTVINRDILFNGTPLAWRKFANSLKIRILMRESKKTNVATDVAAIFNNASEFPVFSSVSEQAALVYNNTTDRYGWYILNQPADGSGVSFGDNSRVSDVMVDMLKATNDPRLLIYAAPTKKSFEANNVNPATPLAYRGQRAGLSSAEQAALYTSTNTTKDDYSVIGRRIRSENRAFLMTYSELLFLKAEAISRGMGVNGTAADAYKDAITASFRKWPQATTGTAAVSPYITEAQITSYFTQPATAFTGGDAGLKQIAEQQWIDAFLNGFEGWANWRRTGFPEITPGPSVLSPIPVRYVYSDNEQNNPNLIQWVKDNMGDKMPDHNVKVWFQP